jgi:hypothetical protein
MTMATCPEGHQSVATDYCDECGLSMAPAAPVGTGSGSGGSAAGAGAGAGASVYGSPGEPCPNCLIARQVGDTFCENCGFDFANEQPAQTVTAPTAQDPLDLEAELRKAEEAARSTPATQASLVAQGSQSGPAPDPLAQTVSADPARPGRASATGWIAIASADRAYYDAVVAEGEIDPNAYPFPAYCPDREYRLDGETVRIGRSGKRGAVDIDLTGPPTDPGVSHLHAVLQARPDGGWSVVDLESMNGTVLNDDTAPIPPNQAFPVEAGYRIHVGVWTTLTLIQTS